MSGLNCMPIAMADHIRQLSNNKKRHFLISGIVCEKYVPGWEALYYSMANFVYTIFKQRAALYDTMEG